MTNTNTIQINEARKEAVKLSRRLVGKHKPIDFRDDKTRNIQRDSFLVSIKDLYLRLENARIDAEVTTYLASHEPVDEFSEEGQKFIGGMISNSDPENMQTLKNLIDANGQEDSAVATADGVLLNGNRRLQALRELYAVDSDNRFKYMEVVILPSGDEADGYGSDSAPTIEDIQELEYNYQVRRSGRSEYTGLNLALMYRKNIQRGISLESLMKKDPTYRGLEDDDFDKKVKENKARYLDTLDEFDSYLDYFGRAGMYNDTEQSGNLSSERWQAFVDWTAKYKTISHEPNYAKYGITANDLGKIKSSAFKIIRQKELHGIDKTHMFMRKIPKILTNKTAKKKFLELSNEEKFPSRLAADLTTNEDGTPKSNAEIDRNWSQIYGPKIVSAAKKINTELLRHDKVSKPVDLLEQALKKLTHDEMNPSGITMEDNEKCMELCKEIEETVGTLFSSFDGNRMNLEALAKKTG